MAHGVTSGRKSMGAAWIMSNSMSLTPAPSPPIKDLGNTAAHSRPMEGGKPRGEAAPTRCVALLGRGGGGGGVGSTTHGLNRASGASNRSPPNLITRPSGSWAVDTEAQRHRRGGGAAAASRDTCIRGSSLQGRPTGLHAPAQRTVYFSMSTVVSRASFRSWATSALHTSQPSITKRN